MKIVMAGAMGRMGRRILELAAASPGHAIGAVFDRVEFAGHVITVGAESGELHEFTLAPSASAAIDGGDVLIDFTLADACLDHVAAAADAGKAVVVGTTGLSPEQQEALRGHAAQVPIVFAPNMSVGVNLLFKITAEVASILGLDYNVEITEIHHNQKKDSPSGTAMRLAERVAEALDFDIGSSLVHGREGMVGARPRAEIGMHSLRGGDVAGEHTVAFIGQGERVELTHKAHSRDNFASGALVAASFAVKAKPGLYDMQDVLGLK